MKDNKCKIPPLGWKCSRGSGHPGPCAASPGPGHTSTEDVRNCIAGTCKCDARAASLRRWRFVRDDDGHDYMIPADEQDEFQRWLDAGPYWEGYEGEDFNARRIGGSPSLYSFTDPKVN